MARFQFDNTRLNYTIQEKGKEYNLRLLQRAQTIFTTLLNLLPSSYVSAVQGPNYTIALKAVAVELGRIELALEDVRSDYNFALTTQAQTRSDFLYSIIGYLVLVNGQIPPLQWDDVTFRQFLISLIRIYFQGSIPASMADVVNLFYTGNVTVTEDFLLVRQGAAGYDISDEFTFQIDITAPAGGGFPRTSSQTIRRPASSSTSSVPRTHSSRSGTFSRTPTSRTTFSRSSWTPCKAHWGPIITRTSAPTGSASATETAWARRRTRASPGRTTAGTSD